MEILFRFGWDGDDGMGDLCIKNIGSFWKFVIFINSSAVVLGGLDSIEV